MPTITTGPQSAGVGAGIARGADRAARREEGIANRDQARQEFLANQQFQQQQLQQNNDMAALDLQFKQNQAANARADRKRQHDYNLAKANIGNG